MQRCLIRVAMPLIKTWLVLALLLTSCSRAVFDQQLYLTAYQNGQFEEASQLIENTIAYENPRQNHCSKNAVWLLLDQATIAFASGKIPLALQRYHQALEALDYYSQDCDLENFEQILLQDDYKGYQGEDYEQILARIYFALALMQSEDFSNAYALLKQAEDVQQQKQELYRQCRFTTQFELISNPLAKYLLAVFSEKKGDLSNAKILYKQVNALIGRLPEDLSQTPSKQKTVLVIAHNGNAPFKITSTADGSVASALVMETILACHGVDPAWSSFTGIPVPLLMQKFTSIPHPLTISIASQTKRFTPLYNITAVAHQQLEQKKPIIVGRGLARMILRRSAVAYAQKQDPAFGAFMDFAMCIANSTTQSDNRTWGSLPSQIEVARFDLEPGRYCLELQHPHDPPFKHSWNIEINHQDISVINIFNITPGVCRVLIPKSLQGVSL